MDSSQRPAWMEDESVQSIDPRKLDFLNQLFMEGHGKRSKGDLMSFLMPMMRKAKQEHLSFTRQEMNLAIAAIRKYSTEEELKKIDKILARSQGPD